MTNKVFITDSEIHIRAAEVASWARSRFHNIASTSQINCYAVRRGGVPALYAVQVYNDRIVSVDRPEDADFILDDLIDSGRTRTNYLRRFPEKPFVALFDKTEKDAGRGWMVFPWEGNEEFSAEDIPLRLLQYIGEDVARGGLSETPARFLKAWKHYSSGYDIDPASILKVFKDGAEKVDEMVLVKSIPVYSHCEHHLAPFFGVAHVAYIPDGKIVGLSKLSRLVDVFSRRLQVQERLTNQIVDAINDNLQPLGAAVVLECRHMCMEARGIQRQGSTTITSAVRGVFKSPEVRAEFMSLIKE